jgi:hypothetical protein
MVYKIYRSNNYIVVIDENNNYLEEHFTNVLVTKNLTSDTTYTITFIRTESTPLAFYNVPFANIKQQNGSAYASVAAWETWYTTNTGPFYNSGSANVVIAYPSPPVYSTSSVLTQTGVTPVVLAAGATSVSIQNLGNDNVLITTDSSTGQILLPGVSITWDAAFLQKLQAFTFTGTSANSVFTVAAVYAS